MAKWNEQARRGVTALAPECDQLLPMLAAGWEGCRHERLAFTVHLSNTSFLYPVDDLALYTPGKAAGVSHGLG